MAEKTNLEKFLAGEPLNAELAAIRSGDQVEAPAPTKPEVKIEEPERELRKQEREALRRLRMSTGWPVLLRLFEKSFQIHRKAAIALSEQNPLANRDQVAESWAYVAMLKRARLETEGLVDTEVAKLEKREERKA